VLITDNEPRVSRWYNRDTMKKHISFSIILLGVVLSIASLAEAAGAQFPKDLKMGASGADITALQTTLIGGGFHIPSVEAGKVSKGTFGRETFAAVKQYQTAHKLPSTGFVGPLTRGVLNGGMAVAPALQAQVTPPAQPAVVSMSTTGASGTLSLSLQATPGNGTSLSKGGTADVASYKVQAGASDMRLTSIALDINTRLWLYASSVSILDGSTVVGTVSNLNSASFTELTVGSNYRLNIPTNLIIPKGSTKYLTVQVTTLPISDRSSSSIGITRVETRAVDGTGVTDTQALSSTRTFSYTGSNDGIVIITVNPQSPPNMVAPISTSNVTENIVLGVADFKSQAKDGVMRSLTVYMNANFDLSSTALTTLLRDIKVQSGNLIYSADSIGGVADFIPDVGVPVTFSNMAIPLPKDTLVPLAIMVSVNPSTGRSLDGKAASTTMVASGTEGALDNNPLIEDATTKSMAINYAPLLSSDITFSSSNSNIDYTAPVTAKLGQPVLSNNSTVAYPVSFGFSITAGDNSLYISADPNQALSTSSSNLPNNASANLPIGGMIVTPSNVPGDSNTSSITGYYIIPAGSTRQFVYTGAIRNTGGTGGVKAFSINSIKYGTSTAALTANDLVYYNYAALKVNPVF
jgi:peptidoglycan hydrolase-like protein with peptidoglycan-binding domain